jgi:2,4-diaminopentanoate dehydrogenase
MMSETVESIRVQEIFRYDGYPAAETLMHGMGFGMPMDFKPTLARPEAQTATWGPSLHKMAARLGAEIEVVRCTFEKQITSRRLKVAMGVVEAGTVGAIRFETIGVINGRDALWQETREGFERKPAPYRMYGAFSTNTMVSRSTASSTIALNAGKKAASTSCLKPRS